MPRLGFKWIDFASQDAIIAAGGEIRYNEDHTQVDAICGQVIGVFDRENRMYYYQFGYDSKVILMRNETEDVLRISSFEELPNFPRCL